MYVVFRICWKLLYLSKTTARTTKTQFKILVSFMYPYWSQVALWGIASLNKHHFESSSASNKHYIVFQGCSTYWGQCSLVLLPCGTYSRVALFWINTLVSFCFCLKQGHLPFLDPNFSVHSIIYHMNYITSYISYWMFFGRNLRIYSSMHYCHMITNWYLKLPLVTMEAIVTHGHRRKKRSPNCQLNITQYSTNHVNLQACIFETGSC